MKLRRAFTVVLGVSWRASAWMTVVALTLEPVSVVAGLLSTVAIGSLAGDLVAHDRSGAHTAAVWLAAATAVRYLFFTLGFLLRRSISERVSHQVDVEISQLAAGITSVEHLERPDYLDQIELLRQDPQGIGQVVNRLIFVVTRAALSVGAFVVLMSIDPWLGLIPLSGLVAAGTSRRSSARARVLEKETAPVQRLAAHLFSMGTSAAVGKELRVFELRTEVARRHAELWQRRESLTLADLRRGELESVLGNLLMTAVWLGGVALELHRAAHHQATAANVVTVALVGLSVLTTLAGLIDWVVLVTASARAAERFLWLRDHARAAAAAERTPAPVPDRLAQGISLRGVGFTYPGAAHPSLADVDLTFPAGSVVALVGDNGAGKTTLVKLLTRLYEPTLGTVSVDGTDLSAFPAAEWRSRTRAAFQDHLRLETTARESVGAGDLDRLGDDAAVLAALERAGAGRLLTRLPDGLDTRLGTQFGGSELSGGQWQQVALGRALMREDALLTVFDEPTAALDSKVEFDLFERFAANRLPGGVTVLVSHRFSTVRQADLIVVLEGGRVVECGGHDALMRQQGTYAEMFTLQAEAYR